MHDQNSKFRDLSKLSSLDMLEQIRRDHLDILVYMDDSYTVKGSEILSLRAAPTQIYWLGGDSPGIPQIDYFMVDPYVLDVNSQKDYSEKFIRLPTFVAVDSFDVDKTNLDNHRKKLNIQAYDIVFFTTASAKKYSLECINSQIKIIKGVPNSLLIIKTSGYASAIEKIYRERAASEKVDSSQLAFLEEVSTEEEYRALYSLVDMVLDTFPYTGATRTMEALWCNVPVLTKVGQHYYGRMSYSLLKNVNLDSCITWSDEEYVEKGIQMGCKKKLLNQAKKTIRESFSKSIIWNSKRFINCIEKAYLKL